MIVKIKPEEIPFIRNIERLCCKPYPGRSRGCPNYNKKEGCPPNLCELEKMFDFNKDLFLIYYEFNIGKHARNMKKRHPDWTEKQCYNSRHWQGTARNLRDEEIKKYKEEKEINYLTNSPEAYGVNVNLLMKKVGINLEWPPRKITRLVSLGGTRCQ
jgi:predicted metal-binding protein